MSLALTLQCTGTASLTDSDSFEPVPFEPVPSRVQRDCRRGPLRRERGRVGVLSRACTVCSDRNAQRSDCRLQQLLALTLSKTQRIAG